jgi:hypothetical protein
LWKHFNGAAPSQATADSLNISISQLNTRMAQFGIQRNVKVQRTVKVTFKEN